MMIKVPVLAEDIRLERPDAWITKVVDYIEDNITSPILLEELAELSGIKGTEGFMINPSVPFIFCGW